MYFFYPKKNICCKWNFSRKKNRKSMNWTNFYINKSMIARSIWKCAWKSVKIWKVSAAFWFWMLQGLFLQKSMQLLSLHRDKNSNASCKNLQKIRQRTQTCRTPTQVRLKKRNVLSQDWQKQKKTTRSLFSTKKKCSFADFPVIESSCWIWTRSFP